VTTTINSAFGANSWLSQASAHRSVTGILLFVVRIYRNNQKPKIRQRFPSDSIRVGIKSVGSTVPGGVAALSYEVARNRHGS